MENGKFETGSTSLLMVLCLKMKFSGVSQRIPPRVLWLLWQQAASLSEIKHGKGSASERASRCFAVAVQQVGYAMRTINMVLTSHFKYCILC